MVKRERGRPKGTSRVLYTIYDNRTDMPVIVDGTAEQCAKVMGIKLITFYSYITHTKKGKIKRWHIDRIKAQEVEGYELS